MFNPQLGSWLRRISVPTLVLWGASDRIVTLEYGHAYAQRIPGATFQVVAAAGHHPELEQPDAFVDHVVSFIGG
jgi:pimeloyl-ACP methyl ester carboxylesterase